MRNLIDVIDKIATVAPDVGQLLAGVRSSVTYTAPELMSSRWSECAEVLNERAAEHPKLEEIGKIFSGRYEGAAALAAPVSGDRSASDRTPWEAK